MERIDSEQALALLLDPGSWQPWTDPLPAPRDDDYRGQLERARSRAGTDESVITGQGTIEGIPVAVLAGEFGFLAGSVGSAAARRLVGAIRRATQEHLPLVGLPTSGGTRMQEGTPAFVQMVPIAAAIAAHRAAGLAYLVWLRNPTLGGVMATWGSLGQVTAAADADATVGFLGSRVFEAMYPGEQFPAQVQRAGHLAEVGVIDEVVPPQRLHSWMADVLTVLGASGTTAVGAAGDLAGVRAQSAASEPLPDAWDCVLSTRQPQRPGARQLLDACATDLTLLHGTGAGERGDAVLLGLAKIGGRGCVIVAQDRSSELPLGPAALRTARRGYRLAQEWGLPVLSVIDTEGAEVSGPAEEGAIAGEIARNLADLAQLTVPVVSVLLGSGCGGGALAMLPADVVVAAGDAWITPLPPEGASAILHRTTDMADQMARGQHITAAELARYQVVDVLVDAPAHADGSTYAAFIDDMAQQVTAAVAIATVTARRINRFEGAVDILEMEPG